MKQKSLPRREPKKLKDWQGETKHNIFEERKAKDAEKERKHQEQLDRENLDYIVWDGHPTTRTTHLAEAIGIARSTNARIFWALQGSMVGEIDVEK